LLVLASSSPRRSEYLKRLGFDFRQANPEVDERPLGSETARRYVRRLALEKARAVATRFPLAWVIGADTTVVLDGLLLGKPRDCREARRMLRRLSGRWHRVVSALALLSPESGSELLESSTTRVLFRKMTPAEIRWYSETGEPVDKAGAYAIQGKGGLFVERVIGSPSNVVGFPVEAFYRLWRASGLSLPAPRS
jgi:septum formation protein